MALNKAAKEEIINKFRLNENDTASPQVQIAILTHRLNYLKDHFQSNAKDHHSRRGLLKMVGRRRRLLRYLKAKDQEAYKSLIAELNIRK